MTELPDFARRPFSHRAQLSSAFTLVAGHLAGIPEEYEQPTILSLQVSLRQELPQ